MKYFSFIINDELGIHALPASRVVQLAAQFKSNIHIVDSYGKKGDLKNIFELLGMRVKFGEKIVVVTVGEDEEDACNAIKAFFNKYL